MTTQVHPAFEHVAVFHEGSEDLAQQLAPVIQQAVDDKCAVMVCLEEPTWQRLTELVGPAASSVGFAPAGSRYARPATAMKELNEFAATAVRSGAPAALSIGTIPVSNQEDPGWMRYEAAVHNVLTHLPLRGICAYDVTTTHPALLDAATCTHSHVITAGSTQRSPWFNASWSPPATVISRPPYSPMVTSAVTAAAEARGLVTHWLSAVVSADELADLVLVVSELVTNALCYGEPTVELTLWFSIDDHNIVIEVSDRGPGISDPFFELRPPRNRPGGAGLWIAGQLADTISYERSTDGINSFRMSKSAGMPLDPLAG